MQTLHSILSLSLILSGIMVAFSANPIESVLFLIFTFLNAGAILFLFNSEFFGLILIIVYVGAIAVLFLFVIMMLNIKVHKNVIMTFIRNENHMSTIILFAVYSVFLNILIFFRSVFDHTKSPLNTSNDILIFDTLTNIDVLGQVLYNYYLPGFLVAGLILLVALVGAVALTLHFNRLPKKQIISRQLARTDNFLSFFK